jgi:hypothetical protein
MSGLIDPRKMIMWAAGMLLPSIALAAQPTELIVTDEPAIADYENTTVPTPEGVSISDLPAEAAMQQEMPSIASGPHGQPLPLGIMNRILRPADQRFTAQIDALFLWQNNIQTRPLYAANGTQETVLDANQLLPEMAAGPRYGLLLHVDNCYAIEGNYLNVRPFSAERVLPTLATGYEQLNLAGLTFDDITAATVTSAGQFQSAEFNFRRRAGPMSYIAGFRWVEWNEALNLHNTTPLGPETIGVDTANNLYGGQVGYDLILWNRKQRVRVNTVGKAGVFLNQVSQQTDVMSPGTPPVVATVLSDADRTSFFGEIGGTVNFRLTNWLDWRLGYSLFWLSGAATPAQQLSLVNVEANPPTTAISSDGSVFLHGATTGLEARW